MNSQPATDNERPATIAEKPNVQQAVPFLMVSTMERSLRFYVEGLGFTRTKQWIVDGKILWCWLEIGNAALMLQEYHSDSPLATATLGSGISVCFQCRDALTIYREARTRGLDP